MGQEEDLRKMAQLANQAAEAAARGSAACLSLLLAEMNALSQMMPGLGRPAPAPAAESEEQARRVDAEVEAGFDNMPV